MHENEYAYAVARIRANEVNLLTPAETEQLISAESYEAALRLLGDKGWHTDGVGHDYAPMLEEHVNAAWQLLKESAPRIEEEDFERASRGGVAPFEGAYILPEPVKHKYQLLELR